MARNYVEEILEVKGRLRFKLFSTVPLRLSALRKALNETPDTSTEQLKYFPIGAIACLEAYFRGAVRHLIDEAGTPYVNRVEKLNLPNLKFDAGLVRAISGKTITLGELIGHIIPITDLESLGATISVLVDAKFLPALREVRNRFNVEVEGRPNVPLLQNPDEVFRDVVRTFELRHIFAHEADVNLKPDAAEIKRCFENVERFLEATSEYFSNLVYGNIPLTQAGLNQTASEHLQKTKDDVEAEGKRIMKAVDKDGIKEYLAMHDAFVRYANAGTEFAANRIWGKEGTGYSMIYATILRSFYSEHLTMLKNIALTNENP